MMVNRSSRWGIFSAKVWVGALLAGFFPFLLVSNTIAKSSPCPEPTVERGSQCVLNQNATLDHTLEPAPFTRINCQGYRLSPDPNDPPQLAFFLNGAYGVQIRNCVIDGFDFGILAVNGKVPEEFRDNRDWINQHRIKIFNNTIRANNVPIHLVSVDHALILKNKIAHFRKGGVGIIARYNSDFNQIKNNEIHSAFSDYDGVVTRFPGSLIPRDPTTDANPTSTNPDFNDPEGFSGSAILVTETDGPDPTVYTGIINGRLYQFAATQSLELNEDFPGDNLIQGNRIMLSYSERGGMDNGIHFTASLRTIVRNNFVHAGQAVRFGTRGGFIWPVLNPGNPGPIDSRPFPGKCDNDEDRLCLSNNDCNITDFDLPDVEGTCVGKYVPDDLIWTSFGIVIEDNTFEGPFLLAGISLDGENFVVQGNRITGALGDPAFSGILLNGKFPIETAIVTRNIVFNVIHGMRLHHKPPIGNLEPASAFQAEVHLNDFFDYEVAILTSVGYGLPSDLSGNYWGLTCEEGGFDPENVFNLAGIPINELEGEPIFLVGDSQPYGVRVAETPDQDLPGQCP